MTYTTSASVSIAVLVALNFAAWIHVLKFRRSQRRAKVANKPCLTLPISAFSNADHHELLKYHDEVNPLTEAEVYAIYGRLEDAQKVLELALREGRISKQDIVAFWDQQESGLLGSLGCGKA